MFDGPDDANQVESYSTTLHKEILRWYYDNNKNSMIIVWNINGQIIYVSRKMEEFLKGGVADFIGKHPNAILPAQLCDHITNHFNESVEQLQLSNIFFRTDDQKYSFNVIVDKLLIEQEELFICHLENTTKIDNLKEEIIDSEKLILAGQLSAGLVHEIRNPLTSLKGFLQLVQAGVTQKEEYYKVMIGEIDKLEKITSELLQMARPYKSIMKNEYVHEMIRDTIFIMNTQVNMKNIEFIVDVDESLVSYCNASQIKQVLINIIKNGAEAMNNSGIIKIIAQQQNNQDIIIDVIDEGNGITDEMIQELKSPFFTTKADGTGLGLVISDHILKLHNGKINVTTNENKGTIFSIILPLVK